MQQFIAPKILKVNGQSAPCHCTDTITCEYCVQANLILWERNEHPEAKVQEKIIADLKASGVRKTARLLKINPSTVTRWIKTKSIPQKYVERLKGVA